MDAKSLQAELCGTFRVSQTESDGLSICTPFTYDDGDNVVVFVSPDGNGQFRVDDNGEAAFRLMTDGVNLGGRKPKSWLATVEAIHSVSWDEGDEELFAIARTPSDVASVAMKVAECSAQMQVLSALRQDRQVSTFKEEIVEVLRQVAEETNIEARYDFPADPNKQIFVDAYFMAPTPISVVVATSNERLLEAELLWSSTQSMQDPTKVIAVFEDMSKLSEKHLARAAYYTDKTVPWRQMPDAFHNYIKTEVLKRH